MQIANILKEIKGKDLFLYIDKENPDWQKSDSNLIICWENKKVSLSLDDAESLSYFVSSFYNFIDPNKFLISWNAKNIFSYLQAKTEIPFEIPNIVYDLYILNSYFSLNEERPTSFKSSVLLLKKILADGARWSKFKSFYESIYVPLFSKVIPSIENNCLVDNQKKKCVYSHYVIEGQANGRLKTLKIPRDSSYNPHSLGEHEKNNLRPREYEQNFVCFDFKNMEVSVLQWLSKDEQLKNMLKSKKDLYKEIWSKITKQDANDTQRALCKNVFLPVVFGQGKYSLSKKLGISEEIADKLIYSFNKAFPVAFTWVNSQVPDSNNYATDYFGRRRKFDDDQLYKIKNFCIQSPASLICLRKLVRLYEAFSEKARMCFHVHDGYYVLTEKNNINSICKLGKEILEEEDSMFPGLHLKVTCHYGYNLNKLENFKKGEVTV